MHVILPPFKPALRRLKGRKDGFKYMLLCPASIYSKRYEKWVHLKAGMLSDGATFARDLKGSWSWLGHDKLCNDCCWADGTPCTNWQASQFLDDILEAEEQGLEEVTWKWATFLFGGWKIKKRVGWWRRH